MRFDLWWQDVRVALRGLRRARGFSAASVLTLAVGLAGATLMFTLIEGVLLRPLPVRQQERLVVAWKEFRASGVAHWPFHAPDVSLLNTESRTFERVAGLSYYGALPLVAVEAGVPSYLSTTAVTGGFFDTLGIAPAVGRLLAPADDVTGAAPALVISHRLWQRRFGGTADIVGRRLIVSEQAFTIVGVLPPDVDYPRGVEAWISVAAFTATLPPMFRDDGDLVDVVARMRPGVTTSQATSELQTLVTRLEASAAPGVPRGQSPVVRRYDDLVVGDVRTAILLLFGAVALVLLIACANVANLLLLRGEARRPEFAVRSALGATRGRIARQLLVESVILALAAGGLGLAVTWASLQTLVTVVPGGLPRLDAVRIDVTVVMFTFAIAFVAVAMSGVAPALAAARVDLVSQLRGGARGVSGARVRHGRRALVVAQVACAVTTVAAAVLLTRSLLQLADAEMGVAADRLVFVPLTLPQERYADRARHLRFLEEAVGQLEALPGIAGATPVNTPPFAGTGGWDLPAFAAEGQSAERAAVNPSLNLESIHPNYFATLGVGLVRGRAFTEADREGAPAVAIVSEDVAARTWPGEDPIGKRLKFGGPASDDPWLTVVGVARATRYRELPSPRPTLYLPAEQFLVAAQTLALRVSMPLTSLVPLVRDRIAALDPEVRVLRAMPFTELLDAPLARPRFNALLIGLFGLTAVFLAAVGLYAVMAAAVRQRVREIGIRLALGATSGSVRRLVLGEALLLVGAGAAIGLAATVVLTRVIRASLVGIGPLDAAALLTVALLLVAPSAVAAWLPARRATRIDPLAALRAE